MGLPVTFSDTGPKSKSDPLLDKAGSAIKSDTINVKKFLESFVEIVGARDTYGALPIIAEAEFAAKNPDRLSEAVSGFLKSLYIGHSKTVVNMAAAGIVKNAPKLPKDSIINPYDALLVAFFRVPLGSKNEQPAIDALGTLVKNHPEILKLKEYFENKDFSDAHPHKPKSWSFTKESARASLE